MRKKLVAGNWKSYLDKNDAIALLEEIAIADFADEVEVAVFPPMLYLQNAIESAKGKFFVGAQSCSAKGFGAYTGEVAAAMISSVGAQMILVGHSERRQYFGETHDVLKQKVDRVIEAGLKVVFCCGEPLEVRNAAQHKQLVSTQLAESLFHLSESDFKKVIIAYEPVWAIGTGVNATPEQAQEMHEFIRRLVKEKYTTQAAEAVRILYGGSVKPDNAKALFSCADVDGGLVGGASLKANDFVTIIQAAKN